MSTIERFNDQQVLAVCKFTILQPSARRGKLLPKVHSISVPAGSSGLHTIRLSIKDHFGV